MTAYVALAGNRQLQGASWLAGKQWAPKKCFELADLPTDGTLREVEFGRSTREAAVPDDGFERNQVLERWKGADSHVSEANRTVRPRVA